ncbi:hypothetical protein LCGC14_0673870 [marine sediment metagenome]|uniref:Uncharacterized protein n=1 Tax=marine sediment metagenome TaxID=412755 RepID=A0A0F9QVB3_9ZZZZ
MNIQTTILNVCELSRIFDLSEYLYKWGIPGFETTNVEIIGNTRIFYMTHSNFIGGRQYCEYFTSPKGVNCTAIEGKSTVNYRHIFNVIYTVTIYYGNGPKPMSVKIDGHTKYVQFYVNVG